MKTIKYTAVALALIASASFTTSAQAANQGDLILGIYDSNTTGSSYVATDLVLDLGAFNSLQAGETFSLGSAVSSVFSSDTTASLVFNIAGAGYVSSNAVASGLARKEIAFTATTVPTFTGNQQTEAQNVTNVYSGINSALSTGVPAASGNTTGNTTPVAYSAYTQSIVNGNNSFASQETAGGGAFGLGQDLTTPYSLTASVPFYSLLNGTSASVVSDPTGIAGGDSFTFGGTSSAVTLTFDPVATPEPSAYALGLCAAALFWVLNRRRSVA